MEKTKTIALAATLSILCFTLIGVAYAQYMGNQNLGANGYYSSISQPSGPAGIYNGYNACPRNSYAYGTPQNAHPYQLRTGIDGFCR